jgi:hypothetical protein
MTQHSLLDHPADTMTGAVAAYFKQRPGQWISAIDLALVGGYLSWRSRVSDARREHHMTIENRTQSVNGKRHSFYRWIP